MEDNSYEGSFAVDHRLHVWDFAVLYEGETTLQGSLHQAVCDLLHDRNLWVKWKAWRWIKHNVSDCSW